MKAGSLAKATYEDLMKVPENLVAELIDGELHTWPRPRGMHIDTASFLGMRIGNPYRVGDGGPGGWWILYEPELHLGEDVLVPDLGGWRRERMPKIPDDHRFLIEPDWVCEVISPSTARVDRGKKKHIYAEHDVQWLWIVDPDQRILEVFKLVGGVWTDFQVFTGDDVVRAEPFPVAEIDLALIWGPTED
jgi:Uma2 family endonuclease